jgi:CheY-like chemotaxis protein
VENFDQVPVSRHNELHLGRFNFISPESRILLVDDTPMNLEVIEGLLKPTKIKIDVAHSGAECIEKFAVYPYDLVFLDYRMPQMNGIETLEALKEKLPEKMEDTPIISLTASAVSGERERMLDAGFTDYLTKPVSVPEMEKMLVKYLPEDEVVFVEEDDGEPETDPLAGIPTVAFTYPWLDPKEGVEYCGSAEMYLKAIEIFAKGIEGKANLIEKCLSEKDINRYTITVHALKSSSLSIGMESFSQRARSLELAGKSEDMEQIKRDTPGFLAAYRGYKEDLEAILKKAAEKA